MRNDRYGKNGKAFIIINFCLLKKLKSNHLMSVGDLMKCMVTFKASRLSLLPKETFPSTNMRIFHIFFFPKVKASIQFICHGIGSKWRSVSVQCACAILDVSIVLTSHRYVHKSAHQQK